MPLATEEPPLCVDLDRTLIWTDTLLEGCLSLGDVRIFVEN